MVVPSDHTTGATSGTETLDMSGSSEVRAVQSLGIQCNAYKQNELQKSEAD